jgi:uncharacterized protein (DUF2141 family)
MRCFLQAQTGTASVTVQITKVRSAAGKVIVGIWNSKDGFPKVSSTAFRQASVSIANGAAIATFLNVPNGEYAVAAFHDENNNGKFDKRFAGIPIEGVGASNNPHPRFSAPTFSECRFDVHDRDKTISITMFY